ncbi:MAG: hypothetical protein QOF58_6290 [Pseudonocardiales bacterium]|jgi:hypothetical protein|nr:hypothetical protein [Pseudonocardiales bacterium]
MTLLLGELMRFMVAFCVVALTACSPAIVESRPVAAPTTASTQDRMRAMDAKVKLALMYADAFADYNSRLVEEDPAATAEVGGTKGRVSEVCLGARVDQGVSDSRSRTWSEGELYVKQTVYGMVDVTSAFVLETVRTKARSCKTYVGTTNKPSREVTADIPLPELAGVDDSYGFCESVPDLPDGVWDCEVFITHGDLLVAVEVDAAVSGDETRAKLPKILPRVVEALLRAG